MSRIGNSPITVPSGVDISITNKIIKIKGPKGELQYNFLPFIEVTLEDNKIFVKRKGNDKNRT